MPYVTKTEYARVLRDREFLARIKSGRELDSAMQMLGKAFIQKQRCSAACKADQILIVADAGWRFLVYFHRATGSEWRKG